MSSITLETAPPDARFLTRICRCGLLETIFAWKIGDRGCPSCKRVWPESLSLVTAWTAAGAVALQEVDPSTPETTPPSIDVSPQLRLLRLFRADPWKRWVFMDLQAALTIDSKADYTPLKDLDSAGYITLHRTTPTAPAHYTLAPDAPDLPL